MEFVKTELGAGTQLIHHPVRTDSYLRGPPALIPLDSHGQLGLPGDTNEQSDTKSSDTDDTGDATHSLMLTG